MNIQLCDVTKLYSSTPVLGPLSAQSPSGMFTSVLGPSGSGKSTFLRILAGLVEPTSGEVKFNGINVNSTPPDKRNVAMVFQRYALYPLRVYDNLALPLSAKGIPIAQIKERVHQIAMLLGLVPLLDRHVMQLSGGEQQRVALGRAIVREPDLFLLDEPLSNLDPCLRGKLVIELAELHRRLGVTTIMVTHDPAEAMALGQRIMVLRSGKIEQYATPEQIYNSPANRFVAEFTSNYRMNFILGSLIQKGEKLFFVSGGFEQSIPDAWGYVLRQQTASEVLLAVRPEHVLLNSSGSLQGNVIHSEGNGGDFYATVETSIGRLTLRSNRLQSLIPGDKVYLEFAQDFLLMFNALTEKNLAI